MSQFNLHSRCNPATTCEDEDFPAEDSSLFWDEEDPPPKEQIGHPDEWVRIPELYPKHNILIAATPQPSINVVQGEIGN